MAEYKVEVTTGGRECAGTFDHILVTLIGSKEQSEKTDLDNWGIDFKTGTSDTYTIKTKESLGELLLLKVEKNSGFFLHDDEWFCTKMSVTTPEGDTLLFPCYQWLSNGEVVELRGGKAMKAFEDDRSLWIEHRKNELKFKKSNFQWASTNEKIPHHSNFSQSSVPAEIRMSKSRIKEFESALTSGAFELKMKGMLGSQESWKAVEDIPTMFSERKTEISDYLAEHWKDDEFYGSQFLNGVNPCLIKQCSELPPNFPVTEDMVKPYLEVGMPLHNEFKRGNMFLYDQKILSGIQGRPYNGGHLQVPAPLCLLYLNPEKKLIPLAIQIHQQPSTENPIFLPSDSETDWLLAKIFVKNADMMTHQAISHLKNTHFVSEPWAVSLVRNFPLIHPIYKLLIPHFRWILHVNAQAREVLLGPSGSFAMSSMGVEGTMELMMRTQDELTYSSLCIPDDIRSRGLESIPNFYYRDDGLKLWDIIHRFVKAVVGHFYPSDSEVVKDSELQGWIQEIFTRCFLGKTSSGCPQTFQTVEEVVKFITMVIFTVSAQHAAVNNGQFDYEMFTPNGSLLLRKPSPTTKGQSTKETFLETLPNIGETARTASILYVLTLNYSDSVPLGSYPEERFQEREVKQMMKEFQAELSSLSESIKARNAKLVVPYTYLDPSQLDNSIIK
ncbi:hydroperoxide isomerase ALOXE3 [Corythoichthys intestinalis]|uniref:hydroperoxide isomerase ALOXE3 n=1 Tax=Corythoichthys intestinalis TaxID=161448 RepID=UPI0025A500C9|nr:hydroperoxide isomerase ALOXE3 [Corythoichthys intestinalis]XP_061806630.1 hydroperoxide isomerase ALOXE3-like [Nerophis lumbriciformis]